MTSGNLAQGRVADQRRLFLAQLNTVQKIVNNRKIDAELADIHNSDLCQGIGNIKTPPAFINAGLAIQVFSIFDEYISDISREYVDDVLSAYSILQLPLALRQELSANSLRQYTNKIKFFRDSNGRRLDNDAKAQKAIDVSTTIHELSNNTKCTEWAFMPQGYDISSVDLANYLKCVTIDKPKDRINDINPDLMAKFDSVREVRNKIAHSPAHSMNAAELQTQLSILRQLAFAYELLFLSGCYHIRYREDMRELQCLIGEDFYSSLSAEVNFSPNDGKWRYSSPTTGRTLVARDDIRDCFHCVFAKRWKCLGNKRFRPLVVEAYKDGEIVDWATRLEFVNKRGLFN